MLKRFIFAFLCSIIAITFIGVSLVTGEQETLTVPSKVPLAAKLLQITGAVTAIDRVANSINVQKKRGEKVIEASITVDKHTEITEDKVIKSLSDIKMGDKVVVKYTKLDGRNIAKSIEIKSLEKEAEK